MLDRLLDVLDLALVGTLGQDLATVLCMQGTTEEHVDLLEGHLLRLGDEEVNEGREEDVDRHEEVEALEAGRGEELGEELLEDGVGDLGSVS